MRNIYLLLFSILPQLQFSNMYAQTTVILNSVKDNTLYESAAGNISNGSGPDLYSGTNNSNLKRRTLVKFDVLGIIPAGATITAATLTLTVDKTSSGPFSTSIHVVTSDWGEGTSVAATGGGGGGTAATANDATWLNTFFPSSFWTNHGGDFNPASSSTISVSGTGSYLWSSAQIVTDIQNWLDSVNPNYGWIIIGDESTSRTTKRIMSRESPNATARPHLSVTYTLPCIAPEIPLLSLNDTIICQGATTTLTVSGNLNSAASWHLYKGGCGIVSLGIDSAGVFNLNPDSTTTYYIRGEGNCITPGLCAEKTVIVKPLQNPSFSYSSVNFCQSAINPVPVITGLSGGTFGSTPAGLSIDSASGEINLAASTPDINYTVTYTTPGPDCKSSSNVPLTLTNGYNENINATICNGDSVLLGTQILKSEGTYQEIFQSAGGCDSTVNLLLSVKPGYNLQVNAEICAGANYVLGSQTLTASGTYTEVFPASTGCDSVITLHLNVLQVLESSLTAEICAGDSYSLGSQVLDQPGSYSEVFQSFHGCDSTVNLTLTVLQSDTTVSQSGLTLTSNAAGVAYQWIDCDLAAPVSGETNKDFAVNKSGNYAVQLTKNGCIDTSSCHSVTILGIIEKNKESGFKIYPNPSNGTAIVDLGKIYKNVNILITDLSGNILLEKSCKNHDKIQLEFTGYKPGLYNVIIHLPEKTTVLKLITQ